MVRPHTAWSTARPTARGSGIRAVLSPLPSTLSTRWPRASSSAVTSDPVASKIRIPSSPSMATRAKSFRLADSRPALSMASNCTWLSPRVGDSGGTWGRRTYSAGECSRMPSMTQGPVEGRDHREAPGDGGWLEASHFLEPAQVELNVASLRLQRHHVSLEAPAQIGVQVGRGVRSALALVAGHMGGHGKPQHRVVGCIGRRESVGSHLTRTAPTELDRQCGIADVGRRVAVLCADASRE